MKNFSPVDARQAAFWLAEFVGYVIKDWPQSTRSEFFRHLCDERHGKYCAGCGAEPEHGLAGLLCSCEDEG